MQGTEGWIASRLKRIGCSEIGTILGENRYKGVEGLLREKLGLESFSGNLYTLWGNLFEPIITSLVTYVMGTIIYAQNAYFPTEWGLVCSPDGIGVVNTPEGLKIALFEFKCPMARNIRVGQVPANYGAQMQGGMYIIDITEMAVYAEGAFRRCTFEDLNWTNKCQRELINKDVADVSVDKQTSVPKSQPTALGLVFIFIAEMAIPSLSEAYRKLLVAEDFTLPHLLIRDKTVNDFGQMSSKLLSETLKLVVKKKILFSDYTQIFVDADEIKAGAKIHGKAKNGLETNKVHLKSKFSDKKVLGLIKKYSKWAQKTGHVLFGVMPWKLYKLNIQNVNKNSDYINNNKGLFTKVCDFINGGAVGQNALNGPNSGLGPKEIKEKRIQEFMSTWSPNCPEDVFDQMEDVYISKRRAQPTIIE